MTTLNGDIAKVHVKTERMVIKQGPLFPKKVEYKATITIHDYNDNFEVYEKNYGSITFKELKQCIDTYVDEWISKGLTMDRITIDHTQAIAN